MKTNDLARTMDEVKRDFERAQNPTYDFGDIFNQIQRNNEWWQGFESESYLEERGNQMFDEHQQFAPRGQYEHEQ